MVVDVARLRNVRLKQDAYRTTLEVEGRGLVPQNEVGDGFVGPIETLNDAGLSSLRRALLRYAGPSATASQRSFVHPETGERFLIPSETRRSGP